MPYPYEDDNDWVRQLPGYQYLYGQPSQQSYGYDPSLGPGLVRTPQDQGIGYYAAKLGEGLLHGAGSALSAAMYPLGLPKRGIDWLARQGARAQGLNVSDDTTVEQMLGAAALPGEAEGHPEGETSLQQGARGALEFSSGVLLDPATWTGLPFGSATKGEQVAAKILASQPGLQLYAPKAAAALTSAVEEPISQAARALAERFAPAGASAADLAALGAKYQKPLTTAAKVAHYGITGQMALGGVSGIAQAAAQAATQGWTPQATREAVRGVGELGMAGYGQYGHIAGEQVRARAVASQQQFGPTRVLPTDTLPDKVREDAAAWARTLGDQQLSGVDADASALPEHLQPYADTILAEANEHLSALKDGQRFIQKLREEHPAGNEGVTVEQGPDDTPRVIQRDKDGQIVGGAQLDGRNNLVMIAGGRAMGSNLSAKPIYDKLKELGAGKVETLDQEGKPETLSVLGAQSRRAAAESAYPAPVLEGRESFASAMKKTQQAAADLDRAGLGDLLAQPQYAVKKGAQEIGDTGMYSQLRYVVDDPKTQGTQLGADWLKFLSDPKRQIKKAELQDTGLIDYLKSRSNEKVKREEIQQHLVENPPPYSEEVKGQIAENHAGNARVEAAREAYRQALLARDAAEDADADTFAALSDKAEDLRQALIDTQEERDRSMVAPARPKWGPEQHPSYNLRGGVPGTYQEKIAVTPRVETGETKALQKKAKATRADYMGRIKELSDFIDDEGETGPEATKVPIPSQVKQAYDEAVRETEPLERERDAVWNKAWEEHGERVYGPDWKQAQNHLGSDWSPIPEGFHDTEARERWYELNRRISNLQYDIFGSSHRDEVTPYSAARRLRYKLRQEMQQHPDLKAVEAQRPFTSQSHWDDLQNPNVHYRAQEFRDANGERTFVGDEFQADRHNQWLEARANAKKAREKAAHGSSATGYGQEAIEKSRKYYEDQAREYDAEAKKLEEAMPFFGEHNELSAKAFLKEAAERGVDRIAWTTGDTQVSRWRQAVAERVDTIKADRVPGGVKLVGEKGKTKVLEKVVPENELYQYVGRESAADLVRQMDEAAAKKTSQAELRASDLTIGGEGRRQLYDVVLPSVFSKLGKQYGLGPVEEQTLSGNKGKFAIRNRHGVITSEHPTMEAAEAAHGAAGIPVGSTIIQHREAPDVVVHSMKLPPEAREKIKNEGFPLYAKKEETKGEPIKDLGKLLLKLYPEGTHIRETEAGHEVTLPNGVKITWNPNADHIAIDAKAFEGEGRQGYGRKPTAEELKQGAEGVTRWTLPRQAVIDMVEGADMRIPLHEHWHVLKQLGVLSEKQKEQLGKRFKDEEQEADAFADWWQKEQRPADSIWQKIGKGISNLYESLTGTPESVFRAASKAKLEADQVGLPQTLLKRVGERFSGAPPQIKSTDDIKALAGKLRDMAEQGKDYRFWYEDAAKRVNKLAQGNREDEDKLLQLLAIYSPNNPVEANWVDAMQAWDVYKNLGKEAGLKRLNAGEKLIQAGRFGALDRKAENALFRDKRWDGLKTNSFYGNLSALLFPDRKQNATIDIHMLRAFGYPSSGATTPQYEWANALTKHVADQLGWEPWQAQAAMWLTQRGPKGRGVGTFPEAADIHRGAIGMEAVPHPDSGNPLASLAHEPYETRQRYTREAMQALHDPKTGVDELAQAHGLLRDEAIEGPGYYENEFNPGFHILTQMAPEQGYRKGEPATTASVSNAGWENARNYAQDLAQLYDQKAAGLIRAFPSTTGKTHSGYLVELGKTPTQKQLSALVNATPEALRGKIIFDYSPEGIVVHSNGLEPKEFLKVLSDAVANVDTKAMGRDNLSGRPFQSVTEEVKNAQMQAGGGAAAAGRSPAVQGAYDRVLSRLQAVNDRWANGEPEATPAAGVPGRELAGVGSEPSQRGPPPRYAVAPGAVPPPASPAPGPGGPQIERATGNPPRVEDRVTSLKGAIEEQKALGIPVKDVLLAREQRRTWASIDPEVQKEIQTFDKDKYLRKVIQNRHLDDVEVQALDAVTRGAREAKELARYDYLDKKGTPDEAEAWRKYADTLSDYVALDSANIKDGTGTGRALAARARIMQAAQSGDRRFLRAVMREIPGIDEKGAEELQAMFETADPRLADALRSAFGGKWKQWQTILRSFLITPSSEIANGIGNSLGVGVEIADRAASSGVDWLVSKLRGTNRERHLGAVGAGLGSMMEAVPGAMHEFLNERFVQIYKRAWSGEGKPILAPGDQEAWWKRPVANLEYQSGAPFAGKGILARLGRLTATSLDAMEAGDELFQAPLAMQEMGTRAYELAKQKLGNAPDARVRAEALNIIADATHFPQKYPKLISDVRSSVQRRLFKDKPWKPVQVLQQMSQRYPWMSAVLPFIKTPANIARYAIHHSPMGMASPEFFTAVRTLAGKENTGLSQGEAADVVARRLTGTAIFAMAMGAAKLGKITNGGPGDPDEKKALMETGWRPYSIVVTTPAGKAYIPFARFDPISQVVGIASDVAGLADARDGHDAATRAVGSIAENMTDRTYLKGLIDFSQALSDPLRFAANYAIGVGEMHIPRQVARIAQALDPVVRDVKPTEPGIGGFLQQAMNTVKRDIPGVSQTLPAKYGPTGQEEIRPGTGPLGFLMRATSPIQASPEVEGRGLESLMAKIGYVPGAPRTYMTIKGHQIVLDQSQVNLMHKADAAAAQELRMYITNPAFARLPDTIEEGGDRSKEAIMRKVYNKHRDYAKQAIFRQPDFIASARQQIQEYKEQHPGVV